MKTFLLIIHIIGYLTTIWCIYLAYTTWDYTLDRIREEWMHFRRSIYIKPLNLGFKAFFDRGYHRLFYSKYCLHINFGDKFWYGVYGNRYRCLGRNWYVELRDIKKKSPAEKMLALSKIGIIAGVILIIIGLFGYLYCFQRLI